MSVNKFYPINIQNANNIAGTYENVSLLVNAKAEHKGTTYLANPVAIASSDTSRALTVGGDTKITGSMELIRDAIDLQTAIGNIQVKSALEYVANTTGKSFEVWNKPGTGQILLIDTSENTVGISTLAYNMTNVVNYNLQADHQTINGQDVSFNVPETYVNGNLTVAGGFEVWDSAGTGQILVVDNISNSVQYSTLNYSVYNATGYGIEATTQTFDADTITMNLTTGLTVNGNTIADVVPGGYIHLRYNGTTLLEISRYALYSPLSISADFNQITFNYAPVFRSDFYIDNGYTTIYGNGYGAGYLRMDRGTLQINRTSGSAFNPTFQTNIIDVTDTAWKVDLWTTAGSTASSDCLITIGTTSNSYNKLVSNCATNTFTNATTVSGALTANGGISTTTATASGLITASAGVVSTALPASNQMTFSTALSLTCSGIGALYCSASPRIKGQYKNASIFSAAATLSLGSIVYPYYCLAPTANMTITLPTAAAGFDGARIVFRRTGGTVTTTVNSASSNILNLTNAATNVILAASAYARAIVCLNNNGTYNWYYEV